VLEDVATAALDHVLAAAGGPVWDEAAFAALTVRVRDDLVDTAVRLAVLTGTVLARARRIEQRLDALPAPSLQEALTDVHVQLARLVHAGFVTATGADRMEHLPRYLRAIDHRLDKLVKDPHRDRSLMQRVQRAEQAYADLRSHRPDAEVAEVRWLVEELRVSLFAQALGTPVPVSEQRILKEVARLAAAGGRR
jgi:ATP-dependent helicase HrpA